LYRVWLAIKYYRFSASVFAIFKFYLSKSKITVISLILPLLVSKKVAS
jgi:hypothetical protein